MLSFPLSELSEQAMSGLKLQQDKVDGEASRKAQYEKATELFSNKSPAGSFREVKAVLAMGSPAGDACYYCERDRYRDIEHVKPKRHYPESAFDWFNYVYACVVCNQDAKRDTYAVFDSETGYIEFDRSLSFDDPLPKGDPVLIDPRSEDPLNFLKLDFETGAFVAHGDTERKRVRGSYTRDLFGLDSADLSRIRRNYVKFYVDRCSEYVEAIDAGNSKRAELILKDILEMEHPTVIVELRRQAPAYPYLDRLFSRLPEEIGRWPRSGKAA